MTRLITFGDSWPYGTELSHIEKPYGRLLAETMSREFLNFANPGSSNEHMILQLKKYIESPYFPEDSLAIFFITDPARTCLIDFNGIAKKIYPQADATKGDHAYAWFKWFHTPLQDEFRANLSLLSLQRMCEQYDIHDYYIQGWTNISFSYPGIDQKKIYPKTCAELFGAAGKHDITWGDNFFVKPNIYHPNQQGHELIANILYKWISDDNTPAR